MSELGSKSESGSELKSEPSSEFDVIVIGSGPGGYVGAIRAAQLGFKTAIVDKGKTLGGTCLNIGCIPSKALLDSSEYFVLAQHELVNHGINIKGLQLNLADMMKRKNKVVDNLTSGVTFLMKKNKIQVFHGQARVTGEHEVTVISQGSSQDGSGSASSSSSTESAKRSGGFKRKILKAKNIILATGSVPRTLPSIDYDGVRVISSTEALELSKIPRHLLVVGAGAIGLEMGSVWLRLGSQVTVIEFSDKICGAMDREISRMAQHILEKQGMKFLLSSQVTEVKTSGKGANVFYESPMDDKHEKNDKSDKKVSLRVDQVLVAAGRSPFSEGLGLEEMGIEKDEQGFVVVDAYYRTKYPSIYAIGDLIPGPMLAHKAEEEGVAAAEIIAGQKGHVNYRTVPSVIYTWPEIASVGQTEEELEKANTPYKSGSFPFLANGRAQAMGFQEGQVKVLAHKETDQVLGVHIVGPRASDMIAEAVVVMEFGGSAEDLARSFHAHPTFSEVMREAALNVEKRARQI